MANEEECNTGLSLGLGLGEYAAATATATAKARRGTRQRDNKSTATPCLDLSFTLCPKRESTATGAAVDSKLKASTTTEEEEDDDGSKIWESNNNNSSRKKLRLTKEQSNLLEDRFKLHTTLNSIQKQSLAEQLNLKPRQVEVWFQNRRARTKLKQTEVDCEFLKKCCENLTDENKRLRKELQELRSLKGGGGSPLFIQLQKATGCCPSCGKIMRKSSSEGKTTTAVIDVVLNNNKWQSSGFNPTTK